MPSLTRRSTRAIALIPLGVLAVHELPSVHELPYLLAYGSDLTAALDDQGHGYLSWLAPTVTAIFACLFAKTVLPRTGKRSSPKRSFLALWLTISLALFSLYCGQELAEGALFAGHPSGLAAIVGSGGRQAVPLAFVIGLLITLLLKVKELDSFNAIGTNFAIPRWLPPTFTPDTHYLLCDSLLGNNLGKRGPPAHS